MIPTQIINTEILAGADIVDPPAVVRIRIHDRKPGTVKKVILKKVVPGAGMTGPVRATIAERLAGFRHTEKPGESPERAGHGHHPGKIRIRVNPPKEITGDYRQALFADRGIPLPLAGKVPR